jgi:hypothetical protein
VLLHERPVSTQLAADVFKYQMGRAMAQAEARVRSRVSPCRICGGQSGTGTGFSSEYFGFPLSISFHRAPLHEKTNHLHHTVAQ